jgi:hypothetical protein
MFVDEESQGNYDTTASGGDGASAAAAPAASAPPAQPDTSAAATTAADADPSRTAQIIGQPQSAPLEGEVMDSKTDNRESQGHKMLNGILGALGGTNEVQYSRDPQGKLIATHVRSGPGQQWKRIIAGALTGAAAGASVAPGPGAIGRAAGAGFGAGMKMVKDVDDRKYQRANEDAEYQQKQSVVNAQVAHLNQMTAESVWRGLREKNAVAIERNEADVATHNLISGDPGNEDLGVYASFQKFLETHGGNAQQIGQQNANRELRALPAYDASGKVTGVHVFRVTKAWDQQKLTEDAPLNFGPKFDKDGKVSPDIRVVSAGSMTKGEYATMNQAGALKMLAAQDTAAQIGERKSGTAKNYAEVKKLNAETEQLSTINTEEDAQNAAQALVEGRMDPSQLSKRASKGSNTWNHIMKLADDYSMKTSNTHFDAGQASIDYKYASNPQTQNTLRYLNGLTGVDGKSGNLGTLISASNNIPRATSFPPLNDAAAWAKLNAGDPKMAAYHAAVVEVSDQVAKILQGGGSGNATSDKKLEQATELFRVGFTKDQITETATTLRDLLGNRKQALIQGNRYLERSFGTGGQQKPTLAGPGTAAPASTSGRQRVVNKATGEMLEWDGTKWAPVAQGK